MKIPFPFATFLKRFVPESLFARALLILVIPACMVQLVAVFVFYERHWDNVTRHMSNSLAGEMALVVHEILNSPASEHEQFSTIAGQLMGFKIVVENNLKHADLPESSQDPMLADFMYQLQTRLTQPYSVVKDANGDLEVRIFLSDTQRVVMYVSIKRLASATTNIFVMAMIGSAVFLTLIATLFLRNQIRPIIRLSRAAEQFGRGNESLNFRPHGALEVRRAGQSFIEMKERLGRLIRSRVEMLAAISHDLRTPITRMKLQLSMMGECKDTQDLKSDLADMEHMIKEYLDFAKGEAGEEPEHVNLNALVSQVVEGYTRLGKKVTLSTSEPIELMLRPNAFRRCLGNIIDNALRYGTQCEICVEQQGLFAHLYIDDNGPGIPEEKREEAFGAFKRLDPSRNLQTGGVGLGLTIVQDIVHGHGGEIALQQSLLGGLRVEISLPL